MTPPADTRDGSAEPADITASGWDPIESARGSWRCAAIAPRPAWIHAPRRPLLAPNTAPRGDAPGGDDDAPAASGRRDLTPVEVSVVNPGTPWSTPPELSVLIVVRNDLARLTGALTAWDDACAGRRAQLVVVDAGSTDRTLSTILSKHRAVTLLRTGTDLGPAWSVDIGLARCEGPVMLLADPGARPTRDDVDALLTWLERHERCALAAAPLVQLDGTPLPGSAPRLTLRHLLVEQSGLARLWPSNPWGRTLATREQDAAAGPLCPCPPAGLLALRREALDEVGPLDTNLPFHMHHLDWCRRLTAAEWELHLVSELGVPLVERPLTAPDDPQRPVIELTSDGAWRRHRDRIRYARKHHGTWGVRCATASLWSYALVEAAARAVGRSEPEHRGLFGAIDALVEAGRVRASA